MLKASKREISPRTSLISAFLVHGSVEIPYFIFPVLVLVVGEDLYLGEFMWIGLGFIGTIGTLAAGLPAPFFGWLSDRYRRGVMMFFSLILSSLGALLIGLFGHSVVILLLSNGLIGLGVGLYHPPGLSWVASTFEDKERGSYSSYFNRILGIHGVGGTIGSAIGPISIYFLIDQLNWRDIYFLWSIPLFILAIIFWIFIGRREVQSDKKIGYSIKTGNNVKTSTLNRKLNFNTAVAVIFIFMFIMSLAWGMLNFILSPFLSEVKGFEISQAALFIGVSHLLGASGQILGGILADKYSEKVALLFASALQGLVILCIYILDPPIIIFALYMMLFVVNAIFWPTTNSFLAKHTTQIGRAFGGFMLIVNVVRSIGPSIDGLLLSNNSNGYFFIFSFCVILSVASFISLIPIKQKREKEIVRI